MVKILNCDEKNLCELVDITLIVAMETLVIEWMLYVFLSMKPYSEAKPSERTHETHVVLGIRCTESARDTVHLLFERMSATSLSLFPFSHTQWVCCKVKLYVQCGEHVEAWVVTDDYFHWASRGLLCTCQGTWSRWLAGACVCERERERKMDTEQRMDRL